MKCIHAKIKEDKSDYITTLTTTKTEEEFKFKCNLCGMEFNEDDCLNLCCILNPEQAFKFNYDLIISGPLSPYAPSRKNVEKNLESFGLLGPEIEDDR